MELSSSSSLSSARWTRQVREGDVVLVKDLPGLMGGSHLNGLEGLVTVSYEDTEQPEPSRRNRRHSVEIPSRDGAVLESLVIPESNLVVQFRYEERWVIKQPHAHHLSDDAAVLEEQYAGHWLPAKEEADEILMGDELEEEEEEDLDTASRAVEASRRGFHQDAVKNYEALVARAREALEKFQFHTDSYCALGRCFLEGPSSMRQLTAARVMYLRAIRCARILKQPFCLPAHWGVAYSMAESGMYLDAVGRGNLILENDKSNSPSTEVLVHMLHWLLAGQEVGEADKYLVTWFPDSSEDTGVLYASLLVQYCRFKPKLSDTSHPHPDLQKALVTAMQKNKFIPEYLHPETKYQRLLVGGDIRPGSPEEAMDYARRFRCVWQRVQGAWEWLSRHKEIVADPDVAATQERTPRRRTKEWFVATRDDPVFIQLLGQWGDTKRVPLDEIILELNSSVLQGYLSLGTDKAASSGETSVKKNSSQEKHDSLPSTDKMSVEDDNRQTVNNELDDNLNGEVGSGSSRKSRTVCTTVSPLLATTSTSTSLDFSFRGAASHLPFALRFQLERCILNSEYIPVKLKARPKGTDWNARWDEMKARAREMLVVFVAKVLPPLLELSWEDTYDRGQITLSELFADEIWESLQCVKRDICKRSKVKFGGLHAKAAMLRAKESLQATEAALCVTEELLGCEDRFQDYISLVKKRALWPTAEYRCKFNSAGELVPIGFEVTNFHFRDSSTVVPQSRRALRESGWRVRDRFALISSLPYHEPHRSSAIIWLEAKPKLCNREYFYLFDKGVGRPNIWLFSPLANRTIGGQTKSDASREEFLRSLGCFQLVEKSKLGDRIGLAFTQTMPITELSMTQIEAMPECTRNGFTFSDGCGVMGIAIAREIQETMKLDFIPGAVQIRMGGVKGMLSLLMTFPANKVGIRPSMVKFPSNHRILEVKRYAQAKAGDAKLFPQALLILDYLGIPSQVFAKLQDKACTEYALEQDKEGLKYLAVQGGVLTEQEYAQRVYTQGQKASGEPLHTHELSALRRSLTAAKNKVNLRCSVVLMQGIMDEYGILNDGEVLVGNGQVSGPVLLCRSPCGAPGDIQRAHAICGLSALRDSYLDQVVVFSSKGNRPLPDMLGGGDLDGDEYFIIHEHDFVNKCVTVDPHDYGSQRYGSKTTVDIISQVSQQSGCCVMLKDQLAVLRNYMASGDLVSESADAWLRIADLDGAGSSRALDMADMHQRSLDARKGPHCIDATQVNRMRFYLSKIKTPHWKGGKPVKVQKSYSVLGIMFERWCCYIEDLEISQMRARARYIPFYSPDDVAIREAENISRKEEAKEMMASRDKERLRKMPQQSFSNIDTQCSMCLAMGAILCEGCKTVWYCSEVCRQKHWDELGHSYECPTGLIDDDSEAIVGSLLDIVFGRKTPELEHIPEPVWNSLSGYSLQILARMAEIEFAESLELEWDRARFRNSGPSYSRPHDLDIYLIEPNLKSRKNDVAVCIRKDGELTWLDSEGTYWAFDEIVPKQRLGNLSGTARIIEGLAKAAPPGSLKHQAMKREMLADVIGSDHQAMLDTASVTEGLNGSQKRAVATVLNPDFDRGFLVLQGPPGCGKTTVLVRIVLALRAARRGVIVAAPSNAAVANIALKLESMEAIDICDICVFGENCNESVQFLNPSHRNKKYQAFFKHYRASNDAAEKRKRFEEFASWLHLDPEVCSLENMAVRCPSVEGQDGKRSLSLLMAGVGVILCTLNTVGSPLLQEMMQQNRFETLLLDEAGQSPEAEFYIAATCPGIKRIVVVGDPMQLPATVLNSSCKQAGYGDSWMTNVHRTCGEKVHLLDTQYRMHPKILEFSNECFYYNRVCSGETLCSQLPQVSLPICVVDTIGLGDEMKEGSSWKNAFEATVIKSILRSDEDILQIRRQSCSTAKTIVITPYQAQVNLLQQQLKKLKGIGTLSIATIDSFQGQEADIVIVSLVRTSKIGFLDDARRLNVAFTRAKQVLRVVGEVKFFKSLSGESTLRQFADHAERNHRIKISGVKQAWKAPDWKGGTLWKPTMTQRFHHCLRPMAEREKNAVFNTLYAVAKPEILKLWVRPACRDTPTWQISALRGFVNPFHIVWVAKQGDASPIAEAHFAGSHKDCSKFIQDHHLLPKGACRVKRDLSGLELTDSTPGVPMLQSFQLIVAWAVSNDIQSAVMDDEIEQLPEGSFELDPHQEKVVNLPPPLLLESRSGTGKTNCLFQHAVMHARTTAGPLIHQHRLPICFVTVSPRLRQELQRRYHEIEAIDTLVLPPVRFFSFRALLELLLTVTRNQHMNMSAACTFRDYLNQRKSHRDLAVDLSELENEIGGVITGSLAAALKQAPLSLDEYRHEKRSNVPNNTDEGIRRRLLIYKEWRCYNEWKIFTKKYDVNDIVLHLIKAGIEQLFDSAYLDEIQDFSYAAIFLICAIAGKSNLHWVCAGDRVQMISPGCSFTFDGLKQTMLSVQPGIEGRLKNVEHLLLNYRMTKDVLELGNAILNAAKSNFPYAVEHAPPEKAVKDLGIRVLLCDWDAAFLTKPSFGTSQAFIYSSDGDASHIAQSANEWLGQHPFILSSLEAKGLEFDDVMIAFEFDRKAWDVASKRAVSLSLLRQLYVAVTRSRRRLVILIKKKASAMNKFFKRLHCNLDESDANDILVEFDCKTTKEEWFKVGEQYFKDHKFKIAASCFNAASEFGWSGWAQGLHEKENFAKSVAAQSFRSAARYFFEAADYEHTLDLMQEIADIPPWNHADDVILDEARMMLPNYFARDEVVKLLLSRGIWDEITTDDLKDQVTSTLFLAHREKAWLRSLVAHCSEKEQQEISKTLPLLVGDYFYFEQNAYPKAVSLYLQGRDFDQANNATLEAIKAVNALNSCSESDGLALQCMIKSWVENEGALHMLSEDSNVLLLCKLFQTPSETVAKLGNGLLRLGCNTVKLAVAGKVDELSILHGISSTEFHDEVLQALEIRFQNQPVEVVRWFCGHKDEAHAKEVILKHMEDITDEGMLHLFTAEPKLRPFLHASGRRFGAPVVPQAITSFKIGDRVVLHGLTISKHLNESHGEVLTDITSGRHEVQLDSEKKKMVKVKPSNLRHEDYIDSDKSSSSSGSSPPSLRPHHHSSRGDFSSNNVANDDGRSSGESHSGQVEVSSDESSVSSGSMPQLVGLHPFLAGQQASHFRANSAGSVESGLDSADSMPSLVQQGLASSGSDSGGSVPDATVAGQCESGSDSGSDKERPSDSAVPLIVPGQSNSSSDSTPALVDGQVPSSTGSSNNQDLSLDDESGVPPLQEYESSSDADIPHINNSVGSSMPPGEVTVIENVSRNLLQDVISYQIWDDNSSSDSG